MLLFLVTRVTIHERRCVSLAHLLNGNCVSAPPEPSCKPFARDARCSIYDTAFEPLFATFRVFTAYLGFSERGWTDSYLITLELLVESSAFLTFDPSIPLNCSNFCSGCVTIIGTWAAVTRGSERFNGRDGDHLFPGPPAPLPGDCARVERIPQPPALDVNYDLSYNNGRHVPIEFPAC